MKNKLFVLFLLPLILFGCSTMTDDEVYRIGHSILEEEIALEAEEALGHDDFLIDISTRNMVEIEEVSTNNYKMTGTAVVEHTFKEVGYFTIRMVFDDGEIIDYEWVLDFN